MAAGGGGGVRSQCSKHSHHNYEFKSRRPSHLPHTHQQYLEGDLVFPSPYVVPSLQYCRTVPPGETPFVCSGTDLMKPNLVDHLLQNPMMIFGQPFTGKTSLFMKLTTQAHAFYGQKHWIRMMDLRGAAITCHNTQKWPTDIFELFSEQLRMSEDKLRDLFKPLSNVKELIRKKKYEKLIRGELFLDGFDEIPVREREYFLKLIPQLKQNREDCPIRVWIGCRSYFKNRLLNVMGEESSFEILGYDRDMQKNLLFSRWKDRLFPKKIRKYEEDRLWEYTHVMYDEFCKEVKDFETTLGTSPLYLEVISSIFANHSANFMTLFRKLREDEKAGPSGHGLQNANCSPPPPPPAPENGSETPKGKGKKKKKNANAKQDDKKQAPVQDDDNDDGVSAPTTQLMCQITGVFTAEFFEYLILTVIDMYCIKYPRKSDMNEKEYKMILDREYRRAAHLYSKYAIKTFPSYEYETIIPSDPKDPDSELVQNMKLIVDEELLHIGLLVLDGEGGKRGLAQFTNKLMGDFFLARHYSRGDNLKIRDQIFDHFFLRVILLDPEAKQIRSFYDNILHFSPGDYRPQVLHDFLVKHYKLDPGQEDEWGKIRDYGSVWHLAVMEGFHRTAMAMLTCFNPTKEEEQVRKLLMIRAPIDIFEGGRANGTICKVDSGGPNQGRHLVSSLSLAAMFGYSVGMSEFLRTFAAFFTVDEIMEEFSTPGTWTPFHYAAMHSNLWFFMYLYPDLLPVNVQTPAGIRNTMGQLPTHLIMSYSWFHIMVLRDPIIPGFDTCGDGGTSHSCSHYSTTYAGDNKFAVLEGPAPACGETSDEEHHICFRDVTCYRDMIKDIRGPGNLLRVSHHECIRLMVKCGDEDVDAAEELTGNTMLHYAALDGHLDTVKFLVTVMGAKAEPKNRFGESPLHYAGLYGHRQVFIFLVKKGSKATLNDCNGFSPINYWTLKGNRIDRTTNGPLSKEDAHFFRACEDIDNLIREQAVKAARKAKEEEEEKEEAAKKKMKIGGGEEEGEVPAPVADGDEQAALDVPASKPEKDEPHETEDSDKEEDKYSVEDKNSEEGEEEEEDNVDEDVAEEEADENGGGNYDDDEEDEDL